MITTSEIAPSPVLAPFVRCYSLREFNTKGRDLIKPWQATFEVSMGFHFKTQSYQLINPHTSVISKGSCYGHVMGLVSQYNGEIILNGSYSFFEIVFRPNGINKIFKILSAELINQLVYADDIFDATVKIFFEQLGMAKGLTEMATLADTYLINYLRRQKFADHRDQITYISNSIIKNAGCINIEKLASDVNMSKRNFDRHFAKHIGISPKLFCCITRFSHALALKLKYPKRNWTSIASQSGYFDQMHLIKNFKKFAGNTPTIFLRQTLLTEENDTSRVDV